MRFHQIFTIFTLLYFTSPAYPQVFHGAQAQQYIQNSRSVWIHKGTHKIRFIAFGKNELYNPDKAGAILKQWLDLPANNTFQHSKQATDKMGITHSRFQQYYKGIRIEGAVYIVHSQHNKLISANGEYYKVDNLNTIPRIIPGKAVETAIDHIGAVRYYWEFDKIYYPVSELVILPDNEEMRLVYKLDIYAVEPLSREFVYIDAHSGEVIKKIDRIHDSFHLGIAETSYEGTEEIITENTGENYRLRDNSYGIDITTYNMQHLTNYSMAVDYTDTDNYWNETADQQDAATNAHFAAEKTFDYFYQTYGRNSYDDEGAALISYVNFGTNYLNAFWNGSVFTYGSGDDYNYSALTSVEVVAHEITHAVTQHSAGLEYTYESGALNESFSDIFGVAVDYFVDPSSFNYTLGEEFALLALPFRNVADPKQYNDPDTYKGEYWATGSNDNGGVHTNCGVQNYWFYLLAEGGTGINDWENTYQVEGIGIEKAAAIAYRNLTVYLTPYSQYNDARFFSIQSAIDLYGSCSEEVIAVTNAWYAVGVGEAFSNEVKADFRISRNYSCTSMASVDFINISSSATNYIWDFGDGTFSTETDPTHTYTADGNYSVKLLALGYDLCSGADSIEKTDIICISDGISPVEALCQPEGVSPSKFGILNFQLNSIDNVSGLALNEGSYIDYTCEQATWLTAGYLYTISARTDPKHKENVYVWLDLDNNGDFSTDELLFESLNTLQYHSGSIIIPEPAVYNAPLRLRIGSDHTAYQLTGCGPTQYGQYEDYTIFIQPNTEAPIVNFRVSDSVVSTNETIILYDRSVNLPQLWFWQIPGALPDFSETQNPEISFDSVGKYDISLIVSNAYGTDSITHSEAVEVLPGYTLGVDSSSKSTAGILFDSGGPEGAYQNSEEYGFLIQPECCKAITFYFMEAFIEEAYDYLYIYDGTDESGELLLTLTGNTIPDTVTANSGSIYIQFVSDGVINKEGFKAVWRADILQDTPPVLQVVDSIHLNIQPGEVINYGLNIGNIEGGGELVYNVVLQDTASYEGWLEIAYNDEGVVEGGSSLICYLQLDGRNLEVGSYTTTLIIYSNDPEINTKQIPLVLVVSENQILFTENMPEDKQTSFPDAIKVYPNPAVDYITVELQSEKYQDIKISILNLKGQILELNPLEIDPESGIYNYTLAELKPEIYLLCVMLGRDKIYSIQFVKE